MKKATIGIVLCVIMLVPILATTAIAKSEPQYKIKITGDRQIINVDITNIAAETVYNKSVVFRIDNSYSEYIIKQLQPGEKFNCGYEDLGPKGFYRPLFKVNSVEILILSAKEDGRSIEAEHHAVDLEVFHHHNIIIQY